MSYKKWIVGLVIFAVIILGISNTSFGFDNITSSEENNRKPNLFMGAIGIGCILYGLQANTETFEWDFLTQVYATGSGGSRIDESYEDPDPYTIKYVWVKYEDIGPYHYEYTYNHHLKKQRTVNIPVVIFGLALFLNAFQEEKEEENIFKEESKFFYSLNKNGFRTGYKLYF